MDKNQNDISDFDHGNIHQAIFIAALGTQCDLGKYSPKSQTQRASTAVCAKSG
ncbi:hypothetical protein H0484_03915 [Pusillimonas sp. CC-YST705]|uniref:Uncharacterized protein n=1 Tax=Mesopusillimonas faecipullorum TaxID=2755040 RepID=A0ABS8CA44_9BURK|nr:hypothetical protein [Mesopusillimonas faecipullorum]MCB5362901.1 hypothetical protein [Mesopusillimonas faecipullorum]